MEFVILDLIDANWLEGSEADVKRDFRGLDATLADAVENFLSEMEAGGGSGYRSSLLGVDGLIALAIAGRIGARDVGRKRDVANAIEGGEEIVALIIVALIIAALISAGLQAGFEADAALTEPGAR
jgi:hypothetical protein